MRRVWLIIVAVAITIGFSALTASGDAKPTSANGLVVVDESNLLFFPFWVDSFDYSVGAGEQVGHGFDYTHYFVGAWSRAGLRRAQREIGEVARVAAATAGVRLDPAFVDPSPPADLLARNDKGELFVYPFDRSTFYGQGGGTKVGHGFHFTHYLVAHWTGAVTTDLIVRNGAGELLLYPFRDDTFNVPFAGRKVGHGFNNFTHYLVGHWSGAGTPDLIVRNAAGELLLYPFRDGTFDVPFAGRRVGHGFNNFTHYLGGRWTGAGTLDLIVRNSAGELLLYPFRNGSFYTSGAGKKVGRGFTFDDYFVGAWTRTANDDLIVRNSAGELYLYPFRNGTFYGQGPKKVGHNFNYKVHLPGQWLPTPVIPRSDSFIEIKGDCRGWEPKIREALRKAYLSATQVTNLDLRECIRTRYESPQARAARGLSVETGEATCTTCPANTRGEAPYYWMLGKHSGRPWDPTDQAKICADTMQEQNASEEQIADTFVHEWAHTCGWQHCDCDKGVPNCKSDATC